MDAQWKKCFGKTFFFQIKNMKRSLRNSNADDLLNICDVAGHYVKPVAEVACELDIDRTIPSILRGVKSVWYTDKNDTVSVILINYNCNQFRIVNIVV